MKRFTIIMALTLLFAMPGFAEHVRPETAQKAAKTFLSAKLVNQPQISLVDFVDRALFPNLYVYGNDHCFVIMAADDRVQPVLGYSLTSTFGTESLPDNVRYWLQGYNDEIQYVTDNFTQATYEVTRQWEDLVSGTPAPERSRIVVGPLITTAWDQTYPYNYYCPSTSGGSGGHSYTGCVATAMAQVIKYYNAPVHGIGSHTYTHSIYGEQTANFGETTYQWNNMPTQIFSNSSQAQIYAVATLIYQCGVGVDMNYGTGTNGSGASSIKIAPALRNYFNFSQSTTYVQREDYSNNQWITLIRTELNASRPVVYNGSYTSGHSFVCDGYDSGTYGSYYFHFNWGWSGSYNGYFSIDNMTPGGSGAGGGGHNYSYNQDAVIGIKPSTNTAIPTNLTYTQNGRNVTLSWTGASGASSYNIYCDNNYIGNSTINSYTTTAPYGSSVYYVRSVNSDGELSLSSNSITVTVAYPMPIVDDLQASVSGNNVNLSWTAPEWCYPQTPTATVSYGDGNTNYSWNSIYYAHRYLAADLAQYANKAVYKVSTYVQYPGTYSAYVYVGSTSSGQPNSSGLSMSMLSIDVQSVGWYDFEADNPIILSGTQDLWVVMKQENTGQAFPTPSFDLTQHNINAFYAGSSPTYFYDANPNYNCAWRIKTYITDGTYTYNIYRNGSSIANNVSNTSYNDNNLATGGYTYYVKTNYYGGETEASNSASVVIGNVNYYTITATANPTNGGTVSGGGSYAQGSTCTLVATANQGFEFTNWTKNGQQMSTNSTYSFTVNGNATYVANFTEVTPPEPTVIAEYYPDVNNQNSQYVRVRWNESVSGGGSSGNNYSIYRANCDGSNATIIAQNVTGNQYIDQTWASLAQGEYKYGVSVVNGRGESEIHWDNTPAPLNNHAIDVSAFVAPVANNSNANESPMVNYNRGWIYYDDGTYGTSIGVGGGTIYWGTMFPASMITENRLTKVALYENDYNTNTITVYIYQGGTSAPGTLVYTQTVTPVGGDAFHEITLSSPVTIDPSQNLWVVFGEYGTYPANACVDSGVANNRWVSLDGSEWMDVAEAGVPGYGWMIRAYVEVSGGGGGDSPIWSNCLVKPSPVEYYAITATANPTAGGTVTGGGTYEAGQTCTLTATANTGYHFVRWTKNGTQVSTSSTYSFTVNGNGAYVANFASNGGEVTQTSNFTSGWNWWNTYIEQGGMDGLQMLEDGLGSNGIQIKSQQQYTNYYEGMGWMGMLSAIDNESTYKIKTNAACTVDMVGLETTSGQHPITVGPGWNWIGYPVNSSMSVATAFSNVTPASGDQVKAQNGYANYYDGMGWVGTLSTIEPGMGLLYKSNGSETFTLIYPEGAKSENLVENVTADNNHWVPDMYAYPDNMTVTAVVELDGTELAPEPVEGPANYELAAFANGECRGSVRPMYVEPINRHIAFLTITGEEVTSLSFSLYDAQTGEEIHGANEQINFSNNATVGDVREPYVLHFRGITGVDEWANRLNVFPNPVACGEVLNIVVPAEDLGEMRVEIINALGVVETCHGASLQTITAPDVAGVYTLHITVEGKGTCYRKLVVR